MKTNQYYVFVFYVSFPGKVQVKHLSTSTETTNFKLAKALCDALSGGVDWDSRMQQPKYKANWENNLFLFPSAKHGNSKAYLEIGILNRYYPGNKKMEESFFADETDNSKNLLE